MRKCYLVFDQLPSIKDGGLIASYINMISILKEQYEVHVISIFQPNESVFNECSFIDIPIHILCNTVIDNRFFHLFNYLKKGHIDKFLWGIFSGMIYFLSAPFLRIKMKRLLNQHDIVIISSPAAAMFMTKNVPFILEIHTNYDYFFGSNIKGKFQTWLMRKPALTIFRNQHDAMAGMKHFHSDYLYHYVPDKDVFLDVSYKTGKKILFVGRLHEDKNPLRLIECASELKKMGCEFTLDIYGVGELEDTIRKRIIDLHLDKTVLLKGFLTDKKQIAKYDLFWLTSSLEGFGLVLIEAKANHVPSITVEWSDAVYEVIHHGLDGYIAKSNQEFVNYSFELLENENQRSSFSNHAFSDYVERFSEKTYKMRLFELLDKFIYTFLK
ncbi:MAG: glycosyltransferase [Erysipelotrichaceae bacterium]|nr:glycosyltransferase [Erysipelotrichaceae bacterium]